MRIPSSYRQLLYHCARFLSGYCDECEFHNFCKTYINFSSYTETVVNKGILISLIEEKECIQE